MSYIYKITNIINNKIYIGKTNKTIEERFKEHCKDFQRREYEKRPLYSAMNKYGIKSFKIEKLEECSVDDASEREKYWIEYYNSFKNGYNATKGGDGKSYIDRELVLKLYQEYQNQQKVSELLNINVSSVGDILRDEYKIQTKSRKWSLKNCK